MLKTLLRGEASGALFLIAWNLGTILGYGALQLFLNYLSASNHYFLFPPFIESLLWLWYAILIFPHWWRRLLWTSLYIIYRTVADHLTSNYPFVGEWFDPIYFAFLNQTLLFVGIRKRLWVWVVLLLLTLPFYNQWWKDGILYGYSMIEAQLLAHSNYNLISYVFVPQIATLVLFSVAIAYLMPPIRESSQSRESKE
jgi:hypothetical protein